MRVLDIAYIGRDGFKVRIPDNLEQQFVLEAGTDAGLKSPR